MIIKIEIPSNDVEERRVTSKKDGAEYLFRSQIAYLHTNDTKYPQRFQISLGKDQQSYNSGMYQLDLSSLYIDRDYRLNIARSLKLSPIQNADLKKVG